MNNIPDFKIDKWMQSAAPKVEVGLHGSNVRAVTLAELQQLSPGSTSRPVDFDLQLAYGAAQGSHHIRDRIAEIHSSETVKLTADNVIITPGSIMANFLAFTSLFGPGDHVICQYPTFAQLFVIPRVHGADISLWRMKRENDWVGQLEDLEALIKPNTKGIIITNPGNPTGTVHPEATLRGIIALAEKHNITVHSDEVFTPLFHTSDVRPPPFVSLGYKNSLSTGSVSKAHALPGIRLGWVVSQDHAILERIMTARDYTTIAVSQLDSGVAAYALSPEVLPALMERNLAICKRSLAILDEFAKRNKGRVDWVPSKGAGTAFVRLLNADGTPVHEADFALKVLEKEKLSILPGNLFTDGDDAEFRGYFRILIGDDIMLRRGLELIEKALNE